MGRVPTKGTLNNPKSHKINLINESLTDIQLALI